MGRQVILVAGPPAAGKSTYVAQHARPGDIVLDQDAIGARTMRQGLARVAAMTDGTAWVIRCCPGPQRRAAFASEIRATDVVLLRPPDAVLLDRAAHRPNPRRHIQAVRDWLDREARDDPPRQKPGGIKKSRGLTTTQRGYGWEHQKARAKAIGELRRAGVMSCPYCGDDMTVDMQLDYDHWPPLALGGGGIRRLSHAHCNRKAGQALGMQRRQHAQRSAQRVVVSRRW